MYRLVEKALLRREESRSRSPRSVFAKGRTTSGACEANATHPGRKHTVSTIAAGIGSYVGINAAALCAAIEFGIQPMLFRDSAGNAMYCPYPLSVSLPAMMIGHLTVFGAAEVVFTVLVLSFLEKAQPELFAAGTAVRSSHEINTTTGHASASAVGAAASGQDACLSSDGAKPVRTSKKLVAFFMCLIAAVPLGLLAEGTAWGEWGADEIAQTGAGYTPSGMLHGFSFSALIPDYSVAGMPSWIGYIFSAAIGAAVLIIVFKLLSLAVPVRKSSAAE